MIVKVLLLNIPLFSSQKNKRNWGDFSFLFFGGELLEHMVGSRSASFLGCISFVVGENIRLRGFVWTRRLNLKCDEHPTDSDVDVGNQTLDGRQAC